MCLSPSPRLAVSTNRWLRKTGRLYLFAALLAPLPLVGDDQLMLLSGETVSAVISRIDADGCIRGPRVPDKLDVDGLRRIDRPTGSAVKLEHAVTVHLAGGGRLHVRHVTITDERCTVTWGLGESFSLPIDAVHGIRFDQATESDSFPQALARPSAQHDRVFIKTAEGIQPVHGLIEELTAQNLVFQWNDQEQTVARDKLFAVVLAQLGGTDGSLAKYHVELRNGSLLPGTSISLADDVLHVQLTRATSIRLPWPAVQRIQVRSSRMAYLSDLKPVEEVQQSIVTLDRPWQRDRSILGRPLTLLSPDNGQPFTFEKGIGAHSLCRLTFDVEGRYDWFAATIGIDAETEGRGDCRFTVLADGQSLYSQRVQGSDAPRSLWLEIRDVQRLTLLVEPGDDLDLADHADWCDARIIRRAD